MWDRSEPMRLVTKKKSYKLRIILWPKQRLKSLLSNRLSEKVFLKENEMKFPCRRVLQNPWYLILIRLGFLRKVFSEIFLKLTRGSDLQVYYKKQFWRVLNISQKKAYTWASFEIKLQVYSLKRLLKIGSCTGVFL